MKHKTHSIKRYWSNLNSITVLIADTISNLFIQIQYFEFLKDHLTERTSFSLKTRAQQLKRQT